MFVCISMYRFLGSECILLINKSVHVHFMLHMFKIHAIVRTQCGIWGVYPRLRPRLHPTDPLATRVHPHPPFELDPQSLSQRTRCKFKLETHMTVHWFFFVYVTKKLLHRVDILKSKCGLNAGVKSFYCFYNKTFCTVNTVTVTLTTSCFSWSSYNIAIY